MKRYIIPEIFIKDITIVAQDKSNKAEFSYFDYRLLCCELGMSRYFTLRNKDIDIIIINILYII